MILATAEAAVATQELWAQELVLVHLLALSLLIAVAASLGTGDLIVNGVFAEAVDIVLTACLVLECARVRV